MSAGVFISYAAEHERHASALARVLSHSGVSAFSFLHTPTRVGDDFEQDIRTELTNAAVVVLLWGHRSYASEWTQHEIAVAQHHRKVILPVLLDEVSVLPESLGNMQAVKAFEDPSGWIMQVHNEVLATFAEIQANSGWKSKLIKGALGLGLLGILRALGGEEKEAPAKEIPKKNKRARSKNVAKARRTSPSKSRKKKRT